MYGKSNGLDALIAGIAGPAMSALASLTKEEQKNCLASGLINLL